MRSLCAMQTTGNQVTRRASVVDPGVVRVSLPDGRIRTSGGPETSRRFQARILACPRSNRSMSEHRRKPPQPQGGGRAAARRGAQQRRRAAARHRVAHSGTPFLTGSGAGTPDDGAVVRRPRRGPSRRAAQWCAGRAEAAAGRRGVGAGRGGRRGGGGGGGPSGPGRGGRGGAGPRRSASSTTRAPARTACGAGCRRGSWSPVCASGFLGLHDGGRRHRVRLGARCPRSTKRPRRRTTSTTGPTASRWSRPAVIRNRQIIDYAQIPEAMRNAVISAENKSFEHDKGIDPMGIARACSTWPREARPRAARRSPSST